MSLMQDSIIATFAPKLVEAAQSAKTKPLKGKLRKVVGNLIYAVVPDARLGEICTLTEPSTGETSFAEIVGFDDIVAMLSPLAPFSGLSTSTEVSTTGRVLEVPVGDALLGRVVDGLGRPLDVAEKGELPPLPTRPIHAHAPAALSRKTISRPFITGVRAIDGLLTLGEGQRIGIYGQPGTGKTLLLAQILRNSEADVRVIALIGERGREVNEFLTRYLASGASASSIAVVSTSDRSSIERVKAAHTAMTIAEYFREKGRRVLLIIDSITRMARGLREIGLTAGEPPTRRGFPPSVFTALPGLFERAGAVGNGSITGIFSVLTEGDGLADPVAEETRALLDGHVVLSTKLAGAGHFPAIDVVSSLSRVMQDVTAPNHVAAAQKIRQLIAKYSEMEFLLQVGEYKPGRDQFADMSISKRPLIDKFIRQPFQERSPFDRTLSQLEAVAS